MGRTRMMPASASPLLFYTPCLLDTEKSWTTAATGTTELLLAGCADDLVLGCLLELQNGPSELLVFVVERQSSRSRCASTRLRDTPGRRSRMRSVRGPDRIHPQSTYHAEHWSEMSNKSLPKGEPLLSHQICWRSERCRLYSVRVPVVTSTDSCI